MFREKRKSFINKILFSQITLSVFGLLIIIVISCPLSKNISKQYEINKEVKAMEKEIIDLESKHLGLKDVITYLESDQFVQEQARLNLNYRKGGEEVVVIKDKDEQINSKKISRQDKIIYSIRGLDKKEYKKRINNPVIWRRYFFK